MYILKFKDQNKYVDIDRSSGGYPYPTEIQYAYMFHSIEDANEYNTTFVGKFEVHELTIFSTPI